MSIVKGDTGVSLGDFGQVVEWVNGRRLKRPFRIYQYSYTEAEILDAVYEETSNIGKKASPVEGAVQERITLTEDEKSVFARLVSEGEDTAGDVLLPYMPEWFESYVKGNGSVKYVIKKDVRTHNNSMLMVDEWLKRMIVKYVIWKWIIDAYPERAEVCMVEYEKAKEMVKKMVGARSFVTPQGRPY